MKAIRIILGLMLSFAIIKSCGDLGTEEPRDALMYGVLSTIFLLIPAYLFYSVMKGEDKNDSQNNSSLNKSKKSDLEKFDR